LIDRDSTGYVRRVSQAAEILDGKWKIQILCAMLSGPVRLGQLTRLVPSASKKALRANLGTLERSQLVVRRDLSGNTLHVEYELADDVKEAITFLLDQLERCSHMLASARTGRIRQ